MRKITDQNDVVLIFDEVVTGFRLGLGGAGGFFGVRPDLATFAKALGNGLPIAAIAGKKEIMGRLAPSGAVYQASTFAGNPVSVAAAMATLDTLIEPRTPLPKDRKDLRQHSQRHKDAVSGAQLDCTKTRSARVPAVLHK